MLVMKFGGTSVGNAERIGEVADIVGSRDDRIVVVVSAMSGTTNSLIEAARLAAEGLQASYGKITEDLVSRHLHTVHDLLGDSSEGPGVIRFIEDRIHELDRLFGSIAVL